MNRRLLTLIAEMPDPASGGVIVSGGIAETSNRGGNRWNRSRVKRFEVDQKDLDALERAGLVQRTRIDGYRTRYSLTQAGNEWARQNVERDARVGVTRF